MKVSFWPAKPDIVEMELESGNDVDIAHDLILSFQPTLGAVLQNYQGEFVKGGNSV